VSDAVQVAGAVAILVAYALGQFKVVDVRSYVYLGLNLFGAAALGVIAYVEELWGFLLLEVAWTGVSAWGIVARIRDERRAQPSPS
jgi:hypothetical protein